MKAIFNKTKAMKTNLQPTFLLVALLLTIQISGQNVSDKIAGNWSGKIKLPTMELEMIIKITESENGKLEAKLDVPMQGARNIVAEIEEANSDSLILSVASIFGKYTGAIISNDSINGQWSQGGMSMPLNLNKTDKIVEIKRPQTPKEPFPYLSEEVEYINPKSEFKLAGTLTVPENANKCPAAILISGSGAQDRNETIFEHKPFMVIADYLTRNGIAVLRVDDRGVGGSEGNIREATSEDFADDVLTGVEFLKSRKEIDPVKIGLIGHSEGGLIAPIAAIASTDIAFIVMMAGPGIIGKDILIEQSELLNRAAGMPESVVSQNLMIVKGMVDILCNETDSVKTLDRLQRTFSGGMYPMLDDEKKKLVDAKVAGVNTAWFRYFLSYDPYTTLTKITCPVLALAGEKDLQVPADSNLAAIRNALTEGGNNNFKTLKLDRLNHLFQNCEKGTVAEYAQIEETIEPNVLEIIGNWILEVVK